MTDDYFKTLTPRQQLNDLMHKYAQATGGNYGAGWKELDRRWKVKHGKALSWLRWKHNQDDQTSLTLPAYVETTGKLEEALAIGHEMTGQVLRARAGEATSNHLVKGWGNPPRAWVKLRPGGGSFNLGQRHETIFGKKAQIAQKGKNGSPRPRDIEGSPCRAVTSGVLSKDRPLRRAKTRPARRKACGGKKSLDKR